MTTAATTLDRLMELLPSVYRLRDGDGELRALLAVIAEQVDILEEDLAQLYDDQFIETCAPWVIPYIADLVGNLPLFDVSRIHQSETARATFTDLRGPRFVPPVALRSRTDVARTLSFRRRKATRPMLEELAEDVTGWAVHVVELFELLKWTQFVRNHLRFHSKGFLDLHNLDAIDRVGRAFDTSSHMVDVRPIEQLTGWHNVHNIGFFIWRLRSYGLVRSSARRVGGAGDFRYRVNPLGLDTPLFTRRQRGEFSVAEETEVPQAIRRPLFCEDLRSFGGAHFYSTDEQKSLAIFLDNAAVTPDRIRGADLEPWSQPKGDVVAVDVVRGRMALGDGVALPANVDVTWHYGFSSDLGGGPYPRSSWTIRRNATPKIYEVSKAGPFTTVKDALDKWHLDNQPDAIVSILDNQTYHETSKLVLDPPAGNTIAIEAADERRPHLLLDVPVNVAGSAGSTASLSGLLIEGSVHMTRPRGRIRLLHTTLAPFLAPPSLKVEAAADADASIEIAFSIAGQLLVPNAPASRLLLLDSIVDAGEGVAIGGLAGADSAPAASIERSTIFGSSSFVELSASETIFTRVVQVERSQSGCIRFSFVPDKSRTPRRYRCQPDLAVDEAVARVEETLSPPRKLTSAERKPIAIPIIRTLGPRFMADVFGDPAYAQLHPTGPAEIARGAEDGSEMGAFCHLKQPQRESNLRTRFREYLPFGLDPGIIYVT